jgi:hypothetical protein
MHAYQLSGCSVSRLGKVSEVKGEGKIAILFLV